VTTVTEAYLSPTHSAIEGQSKTTSKGSLEAKYQHNVQDTHVEPLSRHLSKDGSQSLAPASSDRRQAQVLLNSSDQHGDSGSVSAITPEMRKREKWVIAAMCAALFLAGWNDGTLGPILPRIQEVYDVGLPCYTL
jgi:hypothetical protein